MHRASAVRRSGAGSASRVASTTMSAPTTASSIVSTTRTGLPERILEPPAEARARLGPPARHAYLLEVEEVVEHDDVRERRPARADVAEHLRARASQLPCAESGERARPALGDLGRVDDRARHAGARVVERDERELGRKAPPVVLHEVADDLHTGHIQRPDGRAQDVEVAGERLVGDVLHAWVEAHLALALRAQSGLDHVEHLVERDGELLDVVPGEEEDLEPAVFVRVRRGVAS